MAGAYEQSESLRTQGGIADRSAQLNAEFAEIQAADAERRGEVAASRHGDQTRRLIGKQRASLAAQGISVDTGTPLDIQVESGRLGSEDAMTIRTNAFREALGFRSQAENYKFAGKLARLSGDSAARNTLLTGGVRALEGVGKAAGNFNDYRKDLDTGFTSAPYESKNYQERRRSSGPSDYKA
jgi:hypothetical protein